MNHGALKCHLAAVINNACKPVPEDPLLVIRKSVFQVIPAHQLLHTDIFVRKLSSDICLNGLSASQWDSLTKRCMLLIEEHPECLNLPKP